MEGGDLWLRNGNAGVAGGGGCGSDIREERRQMGIGRGERGWGCSCQSRHMTAGINNDDLGERDRMSEYYKPEPY